MCVGAGEGEGRRELERAAERLLRDRVERGLEAGRVRGVEELRRRRALRLAALDRPDVHLRDVDAGADSDAELAASLRW